VKSLLFLELWIRAYPRPDDQGSIALFDALAPSANFSVNGPKVFVSVSTGFDGFFGSMM